MYVFCPHSVSNCSVPEIWQVHLGWSQFPLPQVSGPMTQSFIVVRKISYTGSPSHAVRRNEPGYSQWHTTVTIETRVKWRVSMVKDRNYICFGSSGQLFYMKYSVSTQTFGRWFTGSNHLTLSCSCTHRSACVAIHWVCDETSVVMRWLIRTVITTCVMRSVIRTVVTTCAYTYIVPWGDFTVVVLCTAYVFTVCDILDTFDPHCSCLNN